MHIHLLDHAAFTNKWSLQQCYFYCIQIIKILQMNSTSNNNNTHKNNFEKLNMIQNNYVYNWQQSYLKRFCTSLNKVLEKRISL